MERRDFLTRQREALRAFRRAEALRAEQEAKAVERLADAYWQEDEGRGLLWKVELTHLLDEASPSVPEVLEADPMAELTRSVEAARQAVADLCKLMSTRIYAQKWLRMEETLLYTPKYTEYILEGHTDYVRSVAFSPDGSLLASGSWDKTVRLWGPR